MAFYNQDDEDELGLNGESGGGVQTGPMSATIETSGAPGAASSSANAPDKPGNFVGIQSYLNANKPQAAKLGDQTAGVINSTADQARQGVASLQTEADNKIKGVNSLDSGLVNKLNTGAETLGDDERNTIKQTAAAKYTGPKNETDLGDVYTNAAKATNTAKTNIDNSGTEQGRMNLISQVNSNPRTQGMNVFDNALLQAGGGREKLAQAANANQDVKGSLDAAGEAIRGKIGRADDPSTPNVDESAGAIGQTNKAQADALSQIQNAMNTWKTGFQPKVSQAQQAIIDQQNRISNDLGDNQFGLTDESMQLFGLNDGEQIFKTNLSDYLNPVNPSDINAANVADQTDYARYAALADLAGEKDLMLNPENAALAGTAPKFAANTDKLRADLTKTKADYENMYNTKKGLLKFDVPSNMGPLENLPLFQIDGLTMSEVEKDWLPTMKKNPWYSSSPEFKAAVSNVEKQLGGIKSNAGYNNKVKKN